ncbi:oocyte zinc finger protein XlCOF7.1-like isoform X1 [Hyla sarda]|uniref:oocyte zinc finger protein XlCOF7.1-like isoform X1 n=1 Tax=Hyla sarda TaxID=327740 RepID=UPI0024C24F8A|nr:oocyte zinc finger protein XlCOF7.1-like isoform X1 [Hyla sarda]XP_056387609.1 oocyte zinc finger protein XlCOF7.1-like isoform X1 [Hyla sarda]XP_056387610.1 oocyte zinc finger protein XlCOF7.1-like isoform X1 [Hyla sarda]XP_056387611.1 oocyte zinc finger protein XlCOF7.1-like isoform X1 [Hyla sarda]XP_056387613.1 oocyte zinc finger protein XlCOF7.1-like isoform X1 [Hyla sarda]
MEKEMNTKRIFNLTLEIIYLLTGEDFMVVKKSGELVACRISASVIDASCRDEDPVIDFPSDTQSCEKILHLSNKVIYLLTGEIWKFIDHEGLQAKSERRIEEPQDESCGVNTPERFSSTEDCIEDDVSSPENISQASNQTPQLPLVVKMEVRVKSEDESSNPNTQERSDPLTIKEENEDSWDEQATFRGDACTQTEVILPKLEMKVEEIDEIPIKIPIDSNSGNTWLGYQTGILPDDEELPKKTVNRRPTKPKSGETDEYGQSATTPKQFICTECGKGFSIFSYLTKHQRSHSMEKPFCCTLCGKCFAYKPSLVTHQRVHTGEKPFSCTQCGKLFVSKFNLKTHEKVHTGEKPVQCPACGRCFSNNPALVKHLRIHTGEKPFTCTECGKGFSSRSCLNAHVVLHTGERPFVCVECGKAFANQSNLISHRIIHTGQKPYVCPVCGKGFANQSNLAKHKLMHTSEKPFECTECDNVFARKDGLSKHYERIHKKKLEF